MSPMDFRVVFAAAAFLAAFAAPPAQAAPPDNPCALLTPAQVSVALGVTVGAPMRTTTIMDTCTWAQPGAALVGSTSLQVILRTAADHDQDKALMQQMSAMARKGRTTTVTPVSGLGDDAFYTAMTPGPKATLSVKKGGAAFNVAVQSSQIPVEKQMAIEKVLAQKILSQL